MKIFVNGCSHTDGTEYSTPKKLTWPSSLLDHNVNDKSCSGASNNRIVRSTFEHLLMPDTSDVDMAIIQFTDPTRFEVPFSKNEFDQVIPKVHNIFGQGYEEVAHNGYTTPFCQAHFGTEDQRALTDITLLIHILSLQSFFREMALDYVFMIWWPPHNSDFWQDPGVQRLWRKVDTSRIINADDNNIWSMDKVLTDNGFEKSSALRHDGTRDNHFKPDAHEWLAEQIENFIYNREKITYLNSDALDPEAIYRYG